MIGRLSVSANTVCSPPGSSAGIAQICRADCLFIGGLLLDLLAAAGSFEALEQRFSV